MSPKKQNPTPSIFLVPGRSLTGWEKSGIVVAILMLAVYWTLVFEYIAAGNPYGHKNYWGQDVGTFPLTIICYVGTIALVVICWRHLFLNTRLGRALLNWLEVKSEDKQA